MAAERPAVSSLNCKERMSYLLQKLGETTFLSHGIMVVCISFLCDLEGYILGPCLQELCSGLQNYTGALVSLYKFYIIISDEKKVTDPILKLHYTLHFVVPWVQ